MLGRFAGTALLVLCSGLFAFSADDVHVAKAKAKAKASAALAMESELAKNVVAAHPPKMTLEKAKEEAEKTGKPIVVWVHEEPSKELMSSVSAIHVIVTDYLELKDARCIIFTCKDGKCERRTSTTISPSPGLLKTMVSDVLKEVGASGGVGHQSEVSTKEFFIGTEMTMAPESDEDTPPAANVEKKPVTAQPPKPMPAKKTMMVKQSTPVCTYDALGRKTCRMVSQWVEVPVNEDGSAATDDGTTTGTCTCPNCGTCVNCNQSASSGSGALFPRFAAFREREPIFGSGRFLGRIRALFGR